MRSHFRQLLRVNKSPHTTHLQVSSEARCYLNYILVPMRWFTKYICFLSSTPKQAKKCSCCVNLHKQVPSIDVRFRVQTQTGLKIPASGPVRGSNLNRTENPCFRSGLGFRTSPNRNQTIVNPEPRSGLGFSQIPC